MNLRAKERIVMKKRTIGTLVLLMASAGAAFGQQTSQPLQHWAETNPQIAVERVSIDRAWAMIDRVPAFSDAQEAWVRPVVFNAAALDTQVMRANLAAAPMEGTPEAELNPIIIDLPMPEGGFQAFAVYESPVMEAPLQAKYPMIRTYAGRSLEDDTARVRLTMTPSGFDAQIRRAGLHAYIDRYSKNDDTIYASYYKKDLDRSNQTWACEHNDAEHGNGLHEGDAYTEGYTPPLSMLAPVTRKEYRLAMLCTGEYGQFHGGTVPSALAAIVTCVNRVTGIYEDEVGVKFNLVANNDLLVYTDPVGDGLSNSSSLLNQTTSRINSVIGSANYDVGHGLSTGAGGVAFLGVICTSNKGGGVTGLAQPIGDPFYVDYVAHEMGHQFGAAHTFNGDSGSCAGGNRTASSAYEIGSATTIMGYAGICGNDNVQNNSDAYFHYRSQFQINAHVSSGSGNNCDAAFASGNNTPVVDAGSSITIPMGTPFFLTATGSDPDGDTVLYCWEEYDLGSQQDANAADNGSSPLFRSFSPTTSPTRYFPNLLDLNNGTLTRGEKYPMTNRTMTMRVTARDNNPSGGGWATDTTNVTVTTAAGPFNVTSQSSPTTITNGQMTVTWSVANTNTIIGATQVDILFSTNAGASFDYVLATGVPNDGSEIVTLPSVLTNNGRVMVRGSGFNFFDMNSAAITVDVPPEPIVVTYPNGLPTQLDEGEPTDILVHIDPGTFTLNTSELFMQYAVNFSVPFNRVDLVPQGGDNYIATLPVGTCDDELYFNFTVTPTSGSTVYDPTNPLDSYLATVVCAPNCVADTNGDGALTPADFTAWVAAFNAQSAACDQNGDMACTPADFTAWVANFNAGCP